MAKIGDRTTVNVDISVAKIEVLEINLHTVLLDVNGRKIVMGTGEELHLTRPAKAVAVIESLEQF